MRGVGQTLSRLPAARAFIAGAAILAGSLPAAYARAAAQGDDVAFASSRLGARAPAGGLGGADLPQPLPPSDALRLRQVFTLQSTGRWDDAAIELASVASPLLTGHVLSQRYLGPANLAMAADFATWLKQYPSHPDAPAVHAALLTRFGIGTPQSAPIVASLAPQQPAGAALEDAPETARLVRNPLLDRTVHERAHAGNFDSALHLLSQTRGLDAIYGGQLRAEIARAMFSQGRDEQALRLAESANRQSGGRIALAGYIGGLAAWRLNRPVDAQRLFESSHRAEFAPRSMQAAAAFWAARAHLRNRDFGGYAPLMRQAAEVRHTFYGLLARRSLGFGPSADGGRDTLGAADGEAVLADPHGLRALALLQVGQPQRAEAELRAMWPDVAADAGLSGAVLRVAQAAGLIDLAAQLAGLIETADGRPHDEVLFPTPVLRPAGGFRMDPALVYALTRLESNFDPSAVSSVGARGLMQVMPVTASYISGDGGEKVGRYAHRLHDPAINLSIGQSYVMYLAGMDGVKNDLIRLLGSYNAGPTSFGRMQSTMGPANDPLLFIESIPNEETRGFVPRALAYSWIYAARLNLPSPSLDALAVGAWPVFQSQTPRRDVIARLH